MIDSIRLKKYMLITAVIMLYITTFSAQDVIPRSQYVRDITWNPNGSQFVTANPNGKVELWDKDGNYLQLITIIEGGASTVSWSPSGDLLAVGDYPEGIQIWNMANLSLVQTLLGIRDVSRIRWKSDGSELAAFSFDVFITFDTTDWSTTYISGGSVVDFEWSNDGNFLAYVNVVGGVVVLDAQNYDVSTIIDYDQNIEQPLSITWHPDESKLLVGSIQGIVRKWDLSINPPSNQMVLQLDSEIRRITYQPNGTRIIVASYDGDLVALDSSAYSIVGKTNTNYPLWYVEWSPDGSQLAYAGANDQIMTNVPVVANASDDQTISTLNSTASVTLDGSGSSDVDGSIVSYIWTDSTGAQVATGASPTVDLPVGVHTLTLTVTDDDGATATDEVVITVEASSACSTTILASDTTALTNAITTANGAGSPQTVCLEQGTYTLITSNNSDVDGANGLPIITGDITIKGLDTGATITRDVTASSFRLFNVASGGQLTLENLTLSNGETFDITHDGGAIFNRGTTTLNTVTFTDNTAGNDGGAIGNDGILSVTDSQFTNNHADDEGGAINNETNASLVITGTTFTGNTSSDYGGALFVDSGEAVSVTNSTFTNNSAIINGGAIYNQSTMTVENSQFTDNHANGDGGAIAGHTGITTITGSTFNTNTVNGDGGAIHTTAGAAFTINTSNFIGNTSDDAGGAISTIASPEITISDSTFDSNTALGVGGAIHSYQSTLTVNDTLITGNVGGTNGFGGGGIWSMGPLTVSGGTISNNTSYIGGGILHDHDTGTAFIQNGTVITGNTATHRGGGLYLTGGTVTLNNATVTLNTTTGSSAGGIFNTGDLILNGTTVTSNTSASNGGGIWNSGTLSMSDAVVDGNLASLTTGKGGGLYNSAGNTIITTSELSNNQTFDGGAVYVANGSVTLNGSIETNSAADDGGAVYVIDGGTFYGDFVTMMSNTAVDDGGAVSNKGNLTITNSQLLSNSSDDGGAIHTEAAGTNAINNSCIVGNTAIDDTDGVRSTVATFNATGNWWGAIDGPSGSGSGTGDEVNANVDYASFITTACPSGTGAPSAPTAMFDPAQRMTQLESDTARPIRDTAEIPYTPGLVDETVWRASGTWDLANISNRTGLSWSADAVTRNEESVLELMVPISIGEGNNRQRLEYLQKIQLSSEDQLTLEIKQLNDSRWTVIDTQSGVNSDWQLRTIDLSPYRDTIIQIRFRLVTADTGADVSRSIGVSLDSLVFKNARE